MASAPKAELKMAVSHDLGSQVDDFLEAARRDLERCVGGQTALLEAAKLVQTLHGVADKEIEEGTLDLDQAKKIKLYVTRAVIGVESLAQRFANMQITTAGRMQGLEAAVGAIKKYHTGATHERDTVLAAAQQSPDEQRPGNLSIKQQRLAEETNAGAALKTPSKLPVAAGQRRKRKGN